MYFIKMVCLAACIIYGGYLPAQYSLKKEDEWVRNTMQRMSLDQKIGQLFMVRAYSRSSPADEQILSEFITKYHIGGLCFFQGSPDTQVELINQYQKLAAIPLFMGIDGEWGLGMRFPGETISFPKQLMLGAVGDNMLIYEMGREVARHCKRTGININFAPSLDLFNNPDNLVIFDRSFGDDRENVTSKGYMYMRGMADEGILPCIKHFPGHGDTDVDSHRDLPVLTHSRERFDTLEMYPFRRIVAMDARAMMMGHLQVPAYDNRPYRPASLSDSIIQGVVRGQLEFNGLLFTDAMDMQGVTKYFPPGIAEAEAFKAGNDVLLLPPNLIKAIQGIKDYLIQGKISQQRLDQSVERILRCKFRLGLFSTPSHSSEGLETFLLRNQSKALKYRLAAAAITLLADSTDFLPLVNTESLRMATLSINVNQTTRFQERTASYADVRHYHIMPQRPPSEFIQMSQTLSQFDYVLIAIHTSGKKTDFSRNLPDHVIRFILDLQRKVPVTVVVFGQPHLADKVKLCRSVILAYDNALTTQDLTAQTIFGANAFQGSLPVSINENWRAGHGLRRNSLKRLGYALPEEVGLSSDSLQQIDTIIAHMLQRQASPGAQILIAKDGKIVFEAVYGRLQKNGPPVEKTTIYDLASITKILATTLAAMKLADQDRLHFYHPLRYYIPGIDSTDKASLQLRDILAHHAGLTAGLAFHKGTLLEKDGSPNPGFYTSRLDSLHTIPVARNLFTRSDMPSSIFRRTLKSAVHAHGEYKYSDLGFLFLQKVIENQASVALHSFLDTAFYWPMGLRSTGFIPLTRLPADQIAPTEMEATFRKQLLQGFVHDPGAALMGGVAGHAGLFSNAHNVAVLMQMLLNGGEYGGRRYLSSHIIQQCTQRHPLSSRRGLGFDMKERNKAFPSNMSELASDETFGHTGFTGCAVWADPRYNMILVFNTNRTMATNPQLFHSLGYRTKIQDAVYRALEQP